MLILVFAGLRDALGGPTTQVAISAPCTVAEVRDALLRSHPHLAGQLRTCRIAVGEAFVPDAHVIEPGEEVALIPPVSGGTGDGPGAVALRADALALADVVRWAGREGAGGIVTFSGAVRDTAPSGAPVAHLHYEAYEPMALRALQQIVTDLSREHGATVAIHHRLGTLVPGELAVVIAAGAPHRAEAFAACREAIERLKRDVPIWKKEVAADGAVWVGLGP